LIGEPLETEQGNYRHLALEQTQSTNTLCLDYAAAGEEGNLWITSAMQSGGKGSRGRDWQSQKGNLFASLLLTNPSQKSRLADLTFIAALAVRDAIQAYSSDKNTVAVKWHKISVHIPGESATEGRFASIDENGYMLLELNDGSLRQISTADIFFNKTEDGQ